MKIATTASIMAGPYGTPTRSPCCHGSFSPLESDASVDVYLRLSVPRLPLRLPRPGRQRAGEREPEVGRCVSHCREGLMDCGCEPLVAAARARHRAVPGLQMTGRNDGTGASGPRAWRASRWPSD